MLLKYDLSSLSPKNVHNTARIKQTEKMSARDRSVHPVIRTMPPIEENDPTPGRAHLSMGVVPPILACKSQMNESDDCEVRETR